MATKKILVTGSAGFIGFHLCLALSSQGSHVIGYDNFNAYYSPRLKQTRAMQLKDKGIVTLNADINDGTTFRKCLEENAITHVVHLAAQAGVRYSLENPDAYVQSNLTGFVQILEALKTRPDIPFIYASSSSVYGLNSKIPFSETDSTDTPASFYGATKKSNEVIAHAYHHLFKIPMMGLRFFTVYGPWGRPDMAYYSFTKAILKEEPIKVFAQGEVKRDFTYIDDIVSGLIRAIDSCKGYEIVNLGNHQPETVNRMITILEDLLGKKAIRQELPLPTGDVPMTYADLSKSNRLLGYQPRTSLQEGLKQFVHWYLDYQFTSNSEK